MSLDQLYQYANMAVLLPWLMMILAPNWKWTKFLISNYIFPVIIAILYLIGMVSCFGIAEANFSTLEGISALFNIKEFALVGWLHYLAFDLFVGSWEYQDAVKRGIPHWALVISLIFTLMAGPIGLLIYLGFRQIWGKAKNTA